MGSESESEPGPPTPLDTIDDGGAGTGTGPARDGWTIDGKSDSRQQGHVAFTYTARRHTHTEKEHRERHRAMRPRGEHGRHGSLVR
jgi:hypothetical protein